MAGKRSRVGALIGLLATLVVAVSCASGPQKKDDEPWPAATRSDYEHEKDPCKGENGEPVQCNSNEDCCKGMTCALDPGRSRIIRYCLEG